MALKWIESPKSHIAEAGWTTLAHLVALKDDSELDLPKVKLLVERVQKKIRQAPAAAQYAMNAFIIAVGSYVQPLAEFALRAGENIGPITADLGNNQCQIPFAPDYIRKVQKRGTVGKKRKSVKC
jgi:hypothetical protein